MPRAGSRWSTARAAPCSSARRATCSARTGSSSPCPTTSATPARTRSTARGRRRAPRRAGRALASSARTGELRTVAWHHDDPARRRRRLAGTLASGEDVTDRRAGRAADHLPRLPRPAHRAAEPHAARGAPQARARPLAPHRRRRRAAPHRPRLLQARQRLARPRRRRPADLPPRRRGCRSRAAPRTCWPAPGGDEFLLLLADLHDDPVDRRRAGRRPRSSAALAEPFGVAGAELQVSALDRHRAPPARRARRRGAARPRRHGDVPGEGRPPAAAGPCSRRPAHDPLERLSMAARLRRALAARRVRCCTTSRSSTPGGSRDGVEALLRWHDPERGGWSRPASSSPSPRRPG